MKKTILFLMMAFFAMSLFTSCEKEETMLLSDYVIGEWLSQSIGMSDDGLDDYVRFGVTFEEDHYTMIVAEVVEGDYALWAEAITLPDGGYVIDNEKDMITIDEPQFPGELASDETVTFTVEWTEASDVMVWTPLDGEDAPVITWTKVTGN